MSTETREYAKKLTAQMTLEEKMSQMLYESPAIDRLGIPAYNWWNEALHGVARAGVATVFPEMWFRQKAEPNSMNSPERETAESIRD